MAHTDFDPTRLIAMMLGRLRMTVTHARQQYQLLGQQVFGSPRSFPYLSFRPLAIIKYNHEGLVKAVKDIIKRHDSIQQGPYGFPNASFNKTDYGVCSTCAYLISSIHNVCF